MNAAVVVVVVAVATTRRREEERKRRRRGVVNPRRAKLALDSNEFATHLSLISHAPFVRFSWYV